MKRNYFLLGSVLGLMLVPLVDFVVSGQSSIGMITHWNLLVPILIGSLTVLVLGRLADRRFSLTVPSVSKTVGVAVIIYVAGVMTGLLANTAINGIALSDSLRLGNAFSDWFVLPAFWLLFIGMPSAALLALVYSAVVRKLLA